MTSLSLSHFPSSKLLLQSGLEQPIKSSSKCVRLVQPGSKQYSRPSKRPSLQGGNQNSLIETDVWDLRQQEEGDHDEQRTWSHRTAFLQNGTVKFQLNLNGDCLGLGYLIHVCSMGIGALCWLLLGRCCRWLAASSRFRLKEWYHSKWHWWNCD